MEVTNMFFGPKTLPLDLSDNNMRLHIELVRYEIEAIDDFDKDIQFQYRKNLVLTYYNYDDVDGNWGTVDEHYVATTDLANIAAGFQNLLLQKTDLFEYETVIDDWGKPFMILCCQRNGDMFSLKVQITEGHFEEWLIVELPKLSSEQLNEYAQIFIRWTKDYPVLSEEELSIAKEVPW
jgi:hypothetical protein